MEYSNQLGTYKSKCQGLEKCFIHSITITPRLLGTLEQLLKPANWQADRSTQQEKGYINGAQQPGHEHVHAVAAICFTRQTMSLLSRYQTLGLCRSSLIQIQLCRLFQQDCFEAGNGCSLRMKRSLSAAAAASNEVAQSSSQFRRRRSGGAAAAPAARELGKNGQEMRLLTVRHCTVVRNVTFQSRKLYQLELNRKPTLKL